MLYTGPSNTFSEIWYSEKNEVGHLFFDFYNGAMSTEQCVRLRNAWLAACRRPTKVIILSCGMDFWSNGIDLNRIEVAEDPAEESWRNINAIDDLIHAIITTESHLTLSAVVGNAGAGGVTLALATDRTYVRAGVVLNPHYKSMGLYGSEYWTYLFPKRVGSQKAFDLQNQCLPILATQAKAIGLIDGIIYDDGFDFQRDVTRIAEELARSRDFEAQLAAKRQHREQDEKQRPLHDYRLKELGQMAINFYRKELAYPVAGVNYHEARRNFVHKKPATETPRRLALHRRSTKLLGEI